VLLGLVRLSELALEHAHSAILVVACPVQVFPHEPTAPAIAVISVFRILERGYHDFASIVFKLADGKLKDSYGPAYLRWLVVTTTEQRLHNMVEHVGRAGASGPFYCTTFAQVDPDTLVPA